MTLQDEIQQASWMVEWKFRIWSEAGPQYEKACWHAFQAAVEHRNALIREAGGRPEAIEPFVLPWLRDQTEATV